MPEEAAAGQFRLFIALRLPEAVKDQIEQAQAELRRAAGEARIRWAGREQFHLTLRFLGNVAAVRVNTLAEAVRGACRDFGPLHLRAEEVGFFPDARYPRVVWVGVHDGGQQLVRVQNAIEAAVQAFAEAAPERRGFAGHVTVGRVKSMRRAEAESLTQLAAGMAGRRFGEWTAREVEIIRSELSSAGAKYSSQAAAPLGPATELGVPGPA